LFKRLQRRATTRSAEALAILLSCNRAILVVETRSRDDRIKLPDVPLDVPECGLIQQCWLMLISSGACPTMQSPS
jgi:hypothetical protein